MRCKSVIRIKFISRWKFQLSILKHPVLSKIRLYKTFFLQKNKTLQALRKEKQIKDFIRFCETWVGTLQEEIRGGEVQGLPTCLITYYLYVFAQS